MKLTEKELAALLKLPKWAQDHMRNLERQREEAIRELRTWTNSQTPTPISIAEYVSIGEQPGPTRLTRYVDARCIRFEWVGVALEVTLRDDSISLQWGTPNRTGDVCMQPRSYQHVQLIAKEAMR